MAAVDVQLPAAMPTPRFQPIIEASTGKRKAGSTSFTPSEHLVYKGLPPRLMMKDIGYDADKGISPVAVSDPFRLFSQEAIQHMRDEILKPEVLKDFQFKSNLAACQIRGYATKHAPFVFDAWNNPETLKIISDIAGVELVPAMNLEVGHVNFSVKSEQETKEELAEIDQQRKYFADDEGIAGCPYEDDKPVVGWHTDSYPFVCVLMLSDCTNMVGGETALQTKSGDVMKVRGPEMGCAVVMQGRYITHQALRALGAQERITMVTSFRPKSPYVRDDSVLTTVRPISDLSQLYYEYAEYRLAILEERVRNQLKSIRAAHTASKKLDVKGLKEFFEEQEAFLKKTNREIVEEEKVRQGSVDEAIIREDEEELLRAAKRARVV